MWVMVVGVGGGLWLLVWEVGDDCWCGRWVMIVGVGGG